MEQTSLTFTGPGTASAYQSILRSLTYTNLAQEPSPGNRTIIITVSDGIHQDMTAVIVIVLSSNDNQITIQVERPAVVYTEGEVSIAVGELSGFSLSDMDREAVVVRMSFSLVGALDSQREFLVVDTTSIGGDGLKDGTVIELNETSSLGNYQVSSSMMVKYYNVFAAL